MRGRGKGAASSQRRHAPGAVGYPPSSSSESAGSTPRARCHPSPPPSTLVGAWARSRRHQRRQEHQDPGQVEAISFQRLARARATRQRAGSAACGRRRVATIVLSSAKGHAAAESGERACAAAHVAAGGGQPLSTGAARLPSRVFGSALAPVCHRVPSGADETTTLAHLCATRGSWRWTRVAAGTHWSQCIHLTHECHSCSAATAHGVASGHVVLRNAGRNLASRVRTAST